MDISLDYLFGLNVIAVVFENEKVEKSCRSDYRSYYLRDVAL